MRATNTAQAAIIQKRIRSGLLPEDTFYDPAVSSRRVSDPSIQLMTAAAKGQDRYASNIRNGHYVGAAAHQYIYQSNTTMNHLVSSTASASLQSSREEGTMAGFTERQKDPRKLVQPLFFQRQKASSIACQTSGALNDCKERGGIQLHKYQNCYNGLKVKRQKQSSSFGLDKQSSIDDLNKQVHMEGTSFFGARKEVWGRRKSSTLKPRFDNAQKAALKKHIQMLPSQMSEMSVQAELNKVKHMEQIERQTRERLYAATQEGQSFNRIIRQPELDSDIKPFYATIGQVQAVRDPQILLLMESNQDKPTQTLKHSPKSNPLKSNQSQVRKQAGVASRLNSTQASLMRDSIVSIQPSQLPVTAVTQTHNVKDRKLTTTVKLNKQQTLEQHELRATAYQRLLSRMMTSVPVTKNNASPTAVGTAGRNGSIISNNRRASQVVITRNAVTQALNTRTAAGAAAAITVQENNACNELAYELSQSSFGRQQPSRSKKMMQTVSGLQTINSEQKRRSVTAGNSTIGGPPRCKLVEKSNPQDNQFFYRYAYELGSDRELQLERSPVRSDRPNTSGVEACAQSSPQNYLKMQLLLRQQQQENQHGRPRTQGHSGSVSVRQQDPLSTSEMSSAKKTKRPYDLSKIRKVKPTVAQLEQAKRASQLSQHASRRQFMTASKMGKTSQSKIAHRLAVNKINLFNQVSVKTEYNSTENHQTEEGKTEHLGHSHLSPKKQSTAQMVASMYHHELQQQPAPQNEMPLKKALDEQQRLEAIAAHRIAVEKKRNQVQVKDPPLKVQTVSQKKIIEERKKQEAEIQKVMRQINKRSSIIQSVTNLKGLPTAVDGISGHEFDLATSLDYIKSDAEEEGSENQESPSRVTTSIKTNRAPRMRTKPTLNLEI